MKKRTIALCIVTLALFMLFSMASSGSSEQNYYSDNNTSSENNNTYSDDDSDFDLDSLREGDPVEKPISDNLISSPQVA